ncbi:MAG: OmpH family outer membrane protein [Flavobacteriales bacterium]
MTLFASLSFTFAQKVHYVDTHYILQQMPKYQQAQKQLESTVEQWETELNTAKEKVNQLEIKFESQKVLFTENQIKEKKKEIQEAKNELNELRIKRFGTKGDIIRTRQSLVRPIQDQIWNAINKVAKKRGIGIVLDKSSDLIMVYTNPKFDISKSVINELKGKSTNSNNKKRKR